MPDRLDQIIQDCLELLRQGSSVEECLDRYPEDAEELRPLLELAVDTQRQSAPGISLPARSRVRSRVLAEWDRRSFGQRRAWTWPFLMPRWTAVAAVIVLVILLGSTGTVAAAGAAVPGDLLYPLKEMREDTSLWFALSPEAKVDIYTQLVRERVKELQELTATGRTGDSSVAVARLEGHISQVTRLVEESARQSESGPPASQPGFTALQEIMSEQKSAEGVLQQTIEQAPAEARADLRQALEAIQRGRDRVRSALEELRPSGPVGPAPAPEGE